MRKRSKHAHVHTLCLLWQARILAPEKVELYLTKAASQLSQLYDMKLIFCISYQRFKTQKHLVSIGLLLHFFFL